MTIQEQHAYHTKRLSILQKQEEKYISLMRDLPDDHPGKWKLEGYGGRRYLKYVEWAKEMIAKDEFGIYFNQDNYFEIRGREENRRAAKETA